MRQIAALPYRSNADGSVSILLITSRDTGRWVIPKGNPMRGLAPHEAAAREAFEEAGLSGVAAAEAIGVFPHDKRRADGTVRQAIVDVYPLAVDGQSDTWPERGQRDIRWFGLQAAVDAVYEPGLKAIIANFHPRDPKQPDGGVRSWFRALF